MGEKGNLKGSVGKFKSAIVQLLHDISVGWFKYFVWYGERELFYLTTLAIAELYSADERQMIYEYWTTVE
jgi:hypothetical protein